MEVWIVILISGLYLMLLFGLAYYAELKSSQLKSITNKPLIYALSLTTYCTAWTFYGSVGKAAATGINFLPTYIGPVILAGFWYYLFKSVIQVSKAQRVTSIADFLTIRYNKSRWVASLITLLVILAIVPYISIQLKAISASFNILINYKDLAGSNFENSIALVTAILMSIFIIVFGTRRVDPTEKQEGMVFAISFEAIFKLVAFLIVGIYVTFFIFDGFSDIFNQAVSKDLISKVTNIEHTTGGYWDWFMLIGLSFMVFTLLPRQFYLIAVQNTDVEHARTASWIFPLYLLLINIFIIPLALGGLIFFQDTAIDSDSYILYFPIFADHEIIALIVFFGGFAAATGMIIASAYSVSMMLSNNFLLPVIFPLLKTTEDGKIPSAILNVRRLSIVIIMLLSFIFLISIGKNYPLVEIGLISFVGIAQLAPSFIGAIFWKEGNRYGVTSGLTAGMLFWIFTLIIPTLVTSGMIEADIMEEGLFNLGILRPYSILGFDEMGPVVHGMFWSLLFNSLLYIIISALTKPTLLEVEQSHKYSFSDTYLKGLESQRYDPNLGIHFYKLRQLLIRFFGENETKRLISVYEAKYDISFKSSDQAERKFILYVENLLNAALGTSATSLLFNKFLKNKVLSEGELLEVVTQTQDAISNSKALEIKSKELEVASTQLKHANQRLQDLDKLKDEFISTVTHELRTPLTSIRSISELLSNEKYAHQIADQRKEFLEVIHKESDRLGHLINEILYYEKLKKSEAVLQKETFDLNNVTREAIACLQLQAKKNGIVIKQAFRTLALEIFGDKNKIKQVLINLLSNAIKCYDQEKVDRWIAIGLELKGKLVRISIEDNGVGIRETDLDKIFEDFSQLDNFNNGRTSQGTGLGLSIARKIVEAHQGTLSVESQFGERTLFAIVIPQEK